MQKDEICVDLHFEVVGETLPVDHGYALFGALSRAIPCFHGDDGIGLRLIRGRYIGEGLLDISPSSTLYLRLPVSRIPDYIPLAGAVMDVGGHPLQVGILNTRGLTPSVAIYSHLVTTKNGQDEARFLEEINRQKTVNGVQGRVTPGKRRTFRVHGRQVVGYSVLVDELTAEESIRLQEKGLGGRRKMGCGFFEPWKG